MNTRNQVPQKFYLWDADSTFIFFQFEARFMETGENGSYTFDEFTLASGRDENIIKVGYDIGQPTQ